MYIDTTLLVFLALASVLFHMAVVIPIFKKLKVLKKQATQLESLKNSVSAGIVFIESFENEEGSIDYKIENFNARFLEISNMQNAIKGDSIKPFLQDVCVKCTQKFEHVIKLRNYVTFNLMVGDGVFKVEVFPWKEKGLIAIFEDTTEFQLLTKEQSASEEKFSKLFYNSPASIFIVNLDDNTYLDVNQTFADSNGNDRDFFIGKSIFDIVKYSDETISEIKQAISKLKAGSSVRNQLLKGTANNGSERYNLLSADSIEIDGRSCLIVTSVIMDDYYNALHEIKEKEKIISSSEILLRNLLDNAPFGIILFNNEGKIEFVNKSVYRIYEMPDGFELKNDSIYDNLDFLELNGAMPSMAELCAMNVIPVQVEHKQNTITGKDIWVDVYAEFRKDIDNQADGLYIFLTDITAKKQDEIIIKETLSLLKSTFESTSNALLVVDSNKQIAGYNQKFMEMWNFKPDMMDKGDENLLVEAIKQLKYPDEFLEKVNYLYEHSQEISKDYIELLDGRILYRYSQPQIVDGKTIGRVWSFIDVTAEKLAEEERGILEDVLLFLAKKGWLESNKNFIHQLTNYLNELLEVDFVLISHLTEDKMSAKSLSVSHDGQILENFCYSLEGTPCGDVVNQNFCTIPENVQQLFPKDVLLQDLQVNGYIGVPLWSSRREPIGIIAVLNKSEFKNIRRIENILSIVGIRVAAEIERTNSDNELKESENLFHSIFDHDQDGIFLINDGKIVNCNPVTGRMFKCTKEEIVGKSPAELSPVVQSDGQTSEVLENQYFQQAMHGKPMKFKWLHKKSNGQVFPTEVKLNLFSTRNERLLLAIIHDISERDKHEKQLLQSENRLRKYANHIQNVREEERMFISRELHDNLGQSLTALKIDMFRLAKKSSDSENPKLEEINTEAKHIIGYIDSVIQSVRKIARELRPTILDDLGLIAVIEHQANDFEKRTGISCGFTSNIESINLKKNDALGVYRIVQESLTNIVRHAQATKVDISVKKLNKTVVVEVKDNGIGITSANIRKSKSLGILGMKERVALFGGKISITGKPGQGTCVSMVIPYF